MQEQNAEGVTDEKIYVTPSDCVFLPGQFVPASQAVLILRILLQHFDRHDSDYLPINPKRQSHPGTRQLQQHCRCRALVGFQALGSLTLGEAKLTAFAGVEVVQTRIVCEEAECSIFHRLLRQIAGNFRAKLQAFTCAKVRFNRVAGGYVCVFHFVFSFCCKRFCCMYERCHRLLPISGALYGLAREVGCRETIRGPSSAACSEKNDMQAWKRTDCACRVSNLHVVIVIGEQRSGHRSLL